MVQEKQKPVEEKPEADSKSADHNVKPDPKSTLKNIVALLENSVSAKDTRLLMGRLMRQTAALRKDLSVELLTWFLKHYVDSSATSHSYVMQTLGKVSSVACGMLDPP
jgi:26S proteasome regulatory subunit N3